MTATLSPQEFDLLATRTGLPLTADERAALYEAVLHIEAMKRRVRAAREPGAEPAMIFVPGAP